MTMTVGQQCGTRTTQRQDNTVRQHRTNSTPSLTQPWTRRGPEGWEAVDETQAFGSFLVHHLQVKRSQTTQDFQDRWRRRRLTSEFPTAHTCTRPHTQLGNEGMQNRDSCRPIGMTPYRECALLNWRMRSIVFAVRNVNLIGRITFESLHLTHQRPEFRLIRQLNGFRERKKQYTAM